MVHNYDNREFEQFLKQNADQYRMHPSEKVWKGIHHKLHSRKRWLGFGLLLIGLTVASVTLVMVSSPLPQKNVVNVPANPTIETTLNENTYMAGILNPLTQTHKLSNILIPLAINTPKENVLPEIYKTHSAFSPENDITRENEIAPSDKNSFANITIPVEATKGSANNLPIPINISDQATDDNTDLSKHLPHSPVVDNGLKNISQKDSYPWSIESVLNSFNAKVKKKVTFQLYFTPTISYRRLSENNSFLNSSASTNPSSGIRVSYDVNKAVTHKPGLGLELGLSARYPIAKNIKIKVGLQLNISRYDIKAFNSTGEIATISLDQGSGASSLYTWTKYRNFNGFTPNWLQNYYLSVSAPIGAEYKIAGNKKTSIGVAGTIQPTFVVHDRAFLISTDYKNYAEIPWLIRRWNVNTSFGAFYNIASGKIKWQVGPQVRYQLLSSFQHKYPVKENLFNYGIKVGIMLNQ